MVFMKQCKCGVQFDAGRYQQCPGCGKPVVKSHQKTLPDGIKEVKKVDFHSFIKKVNFGGPKHNQVVVPIPTPISSKLQLLKGDFIVVAVKKATDNEVEEYTTNSFRNKKRSDKP